ncbi:DUF4893 domain-containing protein [Sphingomonas sp. GlSt437]|uniref:DUF4893 domain-containing protein n=1 Tax=Sphingomonas sp. GlSt437 TaxID=3389970 RepID=UPI003A8ABB49
MKLAMNIRQLMLIAGAAAALGGCTRHLSLVVQPSPAVTVEQMPSSAWRSIATPADQASIDRLAARWQAARALASRRFPSRLKAEGALLAADGAVPLPQLTPGPYWCRLIRIGGKGGYVTARPDRCDVAGDHQRQSLTKQDGASLPGGWLYSDDQPNRLIFLGATRLHQRDAAPGYGTDSSKDVIGVIERVGPFHWRFVIAGAQAPADEIVLYELFPALG